MTPLVVAIDGPAGSGKSTVGRAVADRLGLDYLDTGAMYRAVTLGVLRRGSSPHDVDAVAAAVGEIEIEVSDDGVRVDGSDATAEIRGREVTGSVSAVAANSAVRAHLVAVQRAWAAERGGGVLEGRDIGTVVFPDAVAKVFVTASPRVRAQRRVDQLGGDLDEVEAAIIERDRLDSTREDSPLSAAENSLVVDTSEMSIDEVVDVVVSHVMSAGEPPVGAR
ncbi:MAG: (d)CMP kinase [Nocardiopsis sp. BM-2018]|nr:MAG: (d)CMP kinase [Nocardiopsis sp. BM-2018]